MEVVILETVKRRSEEKLTGCFVCKNKETAEEVAGHLEGSELYGTAAPFSADVDEDIVVENKKQNEFSSFTLSYSKYTKLIDDGKIKYL